MMSGEIKKRYIVISAALLLLALVFTDQFGFQLIPNHDDAKIERNDVKIDSLLTVTDEKIEHIMDLQDLQHDGQHALDSLQLLMETEGTDKEDLLKQIKKLKKQTNEYTELQVLAVEHTDSVVPHIIYKDSIVYNYVDSTVYNINTVDTTVYVVDTVYVTDSLTVDPKYIKNKFYKD